MSDHVTFDELDEHNQKAVRQLILHGLAERWGDLDPELNRDLDDLLVTYADGRTLVVTSDGAVVATGTLMHRSENVVEIVRMSVDAGQRRSGLGRLIVEELIATAKDWGVERVVLETNTVWTGAVAFYRSCGFEVTHIEQDNFGENIWFALDITPNRDGP